MRPGLSYTMRIPPKRYPPLKEYTMSPRHSMLRLSRSQFAAVFLLLGLAAANLFIPTASAKQSGPPDGPSIQACTSGTVTVLKSNGYVFQNLYTSGPSGIMYTAPADRGFRWCSRHLTQDGRSWVYGHSAVDSRDGFILECHLYYTSC
jgi:hypothetical protein